MRPTSGTVQSLPVVTIEISVSRAELGRTHALAAAHPGCLLHADKGAHPPSAFPNRKLLMPTTGTISVIIPTHGRDTLLEVALESVLTQTRIPHEIVVVDDLGNSSTRRTVERFAGGSPISVFYLDGSANNPKSAGASRNLGAASITGDYLAFLDDDDYWSPRFLEVAFDTLHREGHDFVVGWTNFEREGRTAPGLAMPAGLTIKKGLSRSGLTGSNALMLINPLNIKR